MPSTSPSGREKFLADLHVGVLSVAAAGGAGPLTIPIWYRYEPGGALTLTTGGETRKAQLIGAAGRFSLCVQDEAPPYRYVTVEGPAAIAPATLDERRAIARRYLGEAGGDAFVAAARDADADVAISMTPHHWLTRGF